MPMPKALYMCLSVCMRMAIGNGAAICHLRVGLPMQRHNNEQPSMKIGNNILLLLACYHTQCIQCVGKALAQAGLMPAQRTRICNVRM